MGAGTYNTSANRYATRPPAKPQPAPVKGAQNIQPLPGREMLQRQGYTTNPMPRPPMQPPGTQPGGKGGVQPPKQPPQSLQGLNPMRPGANQFQSQANQGQRQAMNNLGMASPAVMPDMSGQKNAYQTQMQNMLQGNMEAGMPQRMDMNQQRMQAGMGGGGTAYGEYLAQQQQQWEAMDPNERAKYEAGGTPSPAQQYQNQMLTMGQQRPYMPEMRPDNGPPPGYNGTGPGYHGPGMGVMGGAPSGPWAQQQPGGAYGQPGMGKGGAQPPQQQQPGMGKGGGGNPGLSQGIGGLGMGSAMGMGNQQNQAQFQNQMNQAQNQFQTQFGQTQFGSAQPAQPGQMPSRTSRPQYGQQRMGKGG